MPSSPHGANASTSHQHVKQNAHPSAPLSRTSPSLPPKPTVAMNGNGHYHAAPTSVALDKNKQTATSSHNLMIGVPPAATPNLSLAQSRSPDSKQSSDADGHPVFLSSAKGKQKQVDPIHIPLAQLEQELPLEEADLISLAALVERLANFGYEALQNLAETLPSLPSSSKRAKIFNTALNVRKQFIKLLVLARWSKDISDLQKSRNIIALLSEQQWQHEDVFAGLTDIRKILPNARMRNADLPTAIDVLHTGTYRRLPASIKQMAVAPKPFTDQQALLIVSRLEDALRTRMACRELVPAPLSNYTIHDGKVHFHVPGLFQAQLTASGSAQHELTPSSSDDRWWLLDLTFDVIASGSCAASCNRAFPRKPKRAYRERLRVWGDQQLSPVIQSDGVDESNARPLDIAADKTEQGTDVQIAPEKPTDAPTVNEANPAITATHHDDSLMPTAPVQRDAPLSRLFAFLQERALHYQMDILQHQAYELCRLNWGSNLRIETAERPRNLTVHYWTQAQGAAGATQRVESAAAGGSVQITIVDLPDTPGATETLAALFDGDDDQSSTTHDTASLTTVKRRGLQVTWDADRSILADAQSNNLAISPHSLDIEALLSSVIKQHTLALLRNLQRRILVSDHALSRLLRPEDCTLCLEHIQRQGDEFSTATETTTFNFLQIDLHASQRLRTAKSKPNPKHEQRSASCLAPLRLSVDPVTGRLLLDSEPAQSTTDLSSEQTSQQVASFTASILTTRPNYARLAEASDRINESIDALLDVLYRLDVFARVQEWERMASYLGLRSVRKLALRPQDLAKLGASTLASAEAAPQLFLPLRKSFGGYFLALQPSELAGVSIALVYVVQVMDPTGTPALSVQSIEWLDRAKIAAAASKVGSSGEDVGQEFVATEAGTKRKAPPGVQGETNDVDANFGSSELTIEELADVHSYCIALVSYFRVEQQLRMRGLPYLHVGSNTMRSSPPCKRQRRQQTADARDDGLFGEDASGGTASSDDEAFAGPAGVAGVAALVPSLCLRSIDVLGPSKSHLAKPNISLRVRHWDDDEKLCVEMRIKLRMKSRQFRTLHEVVALAASSDQQSTCALTWIDFDREASLLTLTTRDLDNCMSIFHTHWERVMRMVQLTREVLNASRAWQQRALRLRRSCKKPGERVELCRFELDSVVFSYGSIKVDGLEAKLLVRVRWQDAKLEMQAFSPIGVTQSGGYILEFGSMRSVQVEALDQDAQLREDGVSRWFDETHCLANPHKVMALELRRTVNVAARSAAMHAMLQPQAERIVWRGFLELLQHTLPLVREMAPLVDKCLTLAHVPEVEIKSATWFRFRFQDRYAIDVRLATRSRLVVSDASRALFASEVRTSESESESETTDAVPLDAVFGGSQLLNDLLDATTLARKCSKPKTRIAAQLSSAQFGPIPNIEHVLQSVHAKLDAITWIDARDHRSSAARLRVYELGRALLISLPSASHPNAQAAYHAIAHLVPLLIDRVEAQLARSTP